MCTYELSDKNTIFPERILVVSCGLNPQVVTESIYALALTSDAPFHPTSVKVITTSKGKDKVLTKLSSLGEGWLPPNLRSNL